MSEHAKKKLRRNLKKVGLLEPLIWNRKTGNLVGGHQRLVCLDALEGRDDYLMDVAVVELSDKDEVEQNIALNNPSIMGEFDVDAVAKLLKMPNLTLENTGFDFADVQVMFDDPELSSLFAPNKPTEEVIKALEEQQGDAQADHDRENAEADAILDAANQREATRQRRIETKELIEKADDTEVFAVVLFKAREEREAFMRACEQDPNDRYVDGAKVMGMISAAKKRPAAEVSVDATAAR